jgi:hypothetical protein
MNGYFAQNAERLADYGYDVIPISRHDDASQRWDRKKGQMVPVYTDPGKQPAQLRGWSKGCPRESWEAYAGCGIGILTKRTPALDIDVKDADLADAIQAQADRLLGEAPVRFGQAPKRLMPFQLRGETFPKMRVEWWGVGHEPHDRAHPPAVEILSGGESGGQQVVALGIHPSTGQPYRWERDPDLDLPRGMLPFLDRDKAERLMRTVAGALQRMGATDIKVSGVEVRSHDATAPQTDRRRSDLSIKGDGQAVDLSAFYAKHGISVASRNTTADEIESALRRRGNADLHYDEWIKIGHAIKAALPGSDGEAIWNWWSALSSKNDPDVTATKWGTFKPRDVTAATIFWGLGR